jgi:hypothetical protein
MARRKEIYEELNPETAKGAKNQHTVGLLKDTVSFSKDTSKKTGKSERTIRRRTSRGKKLKGMAAKIKAAGIDDSQKDLTELAKLVDKSPEQAQAIEIDALIQLGDSIRKQQLTRPEIKQKIYDTIEKYGELARTER